jgi:threonine/homoserine/homoserine lactone efflux protein
LTPGPAVLFVLSLSLTAGARAASRGIGGILTANAAYFALAATGVGAVLLASWNLFVVLKWLGAAYLAWTGLRMLLARPRHAPAASEELETSSRVERPFLAGLVTQGANPSAIAFFVALLPQFVDPGAPIARQMAILGVTCSAPRPASRRCDGADGPLAQRSLSSAYARWISIDFLCATSCSSGPRSATRSG